MVLEHYQVEGIDQNHIEKQRFLNIHLKVDNVKVYWHDWDTIAGDIKPEDLPSEEEMEIKARRDLENVHTLQKHFHHLRHENCSWKRSSKLRFLTENDPGAL